MLAAVERRLEPGLQLVAIVLEHPDQLRGRLRVGSSQRGRLALQVLEQDVEIAGVPARLPEGAERRVQLGRPVGVDELPRDSQERAHAAAGDAELVEVLGVDRSLVPASCVTSERR